jgi:hypothetical protein
MALQGLARSMSLPTTLYKVKAEGMPVAQAFDTVATVKEEYDNIGVTPSGNGLEVYTVNTKIWVPEGLLDIEVKSSESQIDFTGDIELYMDRVAIASGIPKAYLDQEFGGFGNSGISLVEQYKPFARHVYTIQSVFLQGLGQLIRLHFAITGEYEYNTPFLLTMRFPANEMGSEQREGKSASLELTQAIIELLQTSLGLEEDEPLPTDVVQSILSKYTFLDPTEIQSWIRQSEAQKLASEGDEDEDEEGGDDGGMDFGDDVGMDFGDDVGGDEEMGDVEESGKKRDSKRLLREKKIRERDLKRKRIKEVSKRYKVSEKAIHLQFLEEQQLIETWGKGKHNLLIKPIKENDLLYDSINILKGSLKDTSGRLKETTVSNMMEELNNTRDDIVGDILKNYVTPDSTLKEYK